MGHNPHISNETATAEATAAVAKANGGILRLYAGTQEDDANTPTSDTVLSEHAIPNPACSSVVNGVATFNSIGTDTDANASGDATWFRVFKADGTSIVFDGSVGLTGSGADLEMADVSIVQHGTVYITELTYTASLN